MKYLASHKVLDSREVATLIEKEHNDLLKDIRRYIGYLGEGKISHTDFFIESAYLSEQNKVLPCYLITKRGCEFVANKMTGEKGTRFTAFYVSRFNEMERQLMPKTFSEALRAYADEIEAKEKALQLLEEAKPKVEFYDAVAGSKDAIEIGEAAKVLAMGVGRNNLFKMLRDKQILMKDNLPYQEFIDRGYFRVVEQKYVKPNGDTNINIKTLVYQKGLDYIRKLLKGA